MQTKSQNTSTTESKTHLNVFLNSGPTTRVSDTEFNKFKVKDSWRRWKDRQLNRELTIEELADSFYEDDGMGYVDEDVFGYDDGWFGIEDYGARD